MAQGRSTKIISMIQWISTRRLSIKKSLSVRENDVTSPFKVNPDTKSRLSNLTNIVNFGRWSWTTSVQGSRPSCTKRSLPLSLHLSLSFSLRLSFYLSLSSLLIFLSPSILISLSPSLALYPSLSLSFSLSLSHEAVSAPLSTALIITSSPPS